MHRKDMRSGVPLLTVHSSTRRRVGTPAFLQSRNQFHLCLLEKGTADKGPRAQLKSFESERKATEIRDYGRQIKSDCGRSCFRSLILVMHVILVVSLSAFVIVLHWAKTYRRAVQLNFFARQRPRLALDSLGSMSRHKRNHSRSWKQFW